jgi:hypothetical protein
MILQAQLRVNDVEVSHRVDLSFNVNDVIVVKSTWHTSTLCTSTSCDGKRVMWKMASHAEMLDKNALPRPCAESRAQSSSSRTAIPVPRVHP